LSVVILVNHADRVIDHLAIDIAGIYVPGLARPKRAGVGPDAKASERLKTAVRGLVDGKPDMAQFTPAMQAFLRTDAGKALWQWVGADGEMTSFTFSEREHARGDDILRYRAILGNATRWFSFTVKADGRIAQIRWW
jgi:hypothetical protein